MSRNRESNENHQVTTGQSTSFEVHYRAINCPHTPGTCVLYSTLHYNGRVVQQKADISTHVHPTSLSEHGPPPDPLEHEAQGGLSSEHGRH